MIGKFFTANHRRPVFKYFVSVGFAVALLLGLFANGISGATPGHSVTTSTMSSLAQKSPPDLDAASSADGSPITLVFQEWVNPDPFYSGVSDTYISMYNPDANYGGLGTMRLHPGSDSRERLLVKFDISRIPPSATVAQATLHLYAWYRNRTYLVMAYAYQVRRHWSELDATWNRATSTDFWAAAGCKDPLFDYDSGAVASTELNWTNQWYTWDVTEMAQQWVTNPASNEGVLIVGQGLSAQYQFRTSEVPTAHQRPYLMVTYYSEGLPPTETPTPTITATPVDSPTPTATLTATQTPVQSPTPTLSPTTTPTATSSPTPVSQVFQQENHPVATYTGVSDTFLSSYRPDTPWGNDDGLRISGRGNGSERALIQFDLQEHIPTNSQVLSAKLAVFAWSRRTLYGMRISAYDVIRPWDVTVATWNRASSSEMWGVPGCDEVGSDRQGDRAASRFVYFTNQFYEWDITSLVQRWVLDPASNQGVALIGHPMNQEIRFRSSEWRVPDQRPKLEVVYIAGGAPPMTPTATRTATLTPSPTTPPTGCLVESPHPYPNDYDNTWTITNPDTNATASRIHFSRLETEADFDYVIIKDNDDNEIQQIDGLYPSGLWSDEVPGRVVKVQLVTDESVREWGFCLDQITTAAP